MGRYGGREITLNLRLLGQYHQRLLALCLLSNLEFQLAQTFQTDHLQTVGNHHGVDGCYHALIEDAIGLETIHECLIEGVELLLTREFDEIHELHEAVGALGRRKNRGRIADGRILDGDARS